MHTQFEGLEMFITSSFFNVWESCLDTTAVVCHLRGSWGARSVSLSGE